jgi:hypothetical protein
MTTTLLLGHGKKVSLLCCPKIINVPESYLTVDIDPINEPDVVADLRKDKLPFEDNSINKVIDTGGLASIIWCRTKHFWKEMYRILKTNGEYYGITKHYIEMNFLPKGFRETVCELPDQNNSDGPIPRKHCFILTKNESNMKQQTNRTTYTFYKTFEFQIRVQQLHHTRTINVKEKEKWNSFMIVSYDIDIIQKDPIQGINSVESYWDVIVTPKNTCKFLKLIQKPHKIEKIEMIGYCSDELKWHRTRNTQLPLLFEYNDKLQNWQLHNFIARPTDYILFKIVRRMIADKEVYIEV